MALRVLLADESTTIKKVMQLALQDFSVEVKAVHAGVDVLDVARAFQPDLIFADVLLQKKNGYEVAASLKNDRELCKIPVVLMWSSFMDLDDAIARSCGAEARLEKPFDVETLRKLVLDLVPKTRSQRLAHFLEYSPRLNEELAEDRSLKTPASATPPPPSPPAAAATPKPPAAAVAPKPPAAAPKPPPTSDLGARLAARAVAGATPPPPPAAPERKGPPSPDAFILSRTAVNLQPLPIDDEPDLAAPDSTPVSGPAPAPAPSGWSMASFDDPSQFDEAEEFQSLELSKLNPDDESTSTPLAIENHGENHGEHDRDDEDWSRQDLSEFKLDLPPISVGECGEGHEAFKLDMGQEEFAPPPTHAKMPSAPPPADMRRSPSPQLLDDETRFGPDLTSDSERESASDLRLEPHAINAAEEEIALPLEPLDLNEHSFELHHTSAQMPSGADQMSASELERVIRAQSREIIEQVVRKIVPDLAATIIREELERLLGDTAVRDTGKNL